MGFTLEHRELGSRGEFYAIGAGFGYYYNPIETALTVLDVKQKSPLLNMRLNQRMSEYPLSYVTALEKSAQIQALIFSNNKDINLTNILNGIQLKAMLETCAFFSEQSYLLKREKFNNFEMLFKDSYPIKSLNIQKRPGFQKDNYFYTAHLKTHENNHVKAQAGSVHRLLQELSEEVTRDFFEKEPSHLIQKNIQNVLAMTSNISMVSQILNDHFIPSAKISARRHTL